MPLFSNPNPKRSHHTTEAESLSQRHKEEMAQAASRIAHLNTQLTAVTAERDAWELETTMMRDQFPGGLDECKQAKAALDRERAAGEQAVPCKLHPKHSIACYETVAEFTARIQDGRALGE